jgi:aminoglycoside N3'-acetyltransferase
MPVFFKTDGGYQRDINAHQSVSDQNLAEPSSNGWFQRLIRRGLVFVRSQGNVKRVTSGEFEMDSFKKRIINMDFDLNKANDKLGLLDVNETRRRRQRLNRINRVMSLSYL